MSTTRPAKNPAQAPVTEPRSSAIGDDGDEQEVGLAAEDPDVREHGHLEDPRDEDEHGDLGRVDHLPLAFLTSTIIDRRLPKSTRGLTSICL